MMTTWFGRRSVKLLISLAFLAAYTIWTFASFYYDTRSNADAVQVRQREQMINHSQISYLLLESGKEEHAIERLRQAKNAGEIAAYVLRKNGEIESGLDRLDVISHLPPSPHGVPVHGDDYSYLRTVVGPYDLIVVVNDSVRGRMKSVMNMALPLLIRDLSICFLLTIAIVAFFMKDITSALRAFTSHRKNGSSTASTRSSEGEMLTKGLRAVSTSMSTLESRNRLLEGHVLPALRGELASGLTPPYEFDCTLVRVDVNEFSTIFNSNPIEPFMAIIDGFFTGVSEIVDRYDGLIYEFIGDEVVFYFKDGDTTNSALRALASLRDICEAAARLDEFAMAQRGYHFRVKCSLAHGKLRFGRQVTGHSLAGAVLIDTVRVLSQIDEKQKNVIFFDESVTPLISTLVTSHHERDVVLKGSSKLRQLFSYVEFEPLARVLNDRTRTSDLVFYRRDEDLVSVLAFLRSSNPERTDFLNTCRELRDFRMRQNSQVVTSAFRDLLESLLDAVGDVAELSEDVAVKLSATLALAKNVLTADMFETQMRDLIDSCLELTDRRVVANAVETFSYFESISEDAALSKLMRHDSNRVAANAIVREGFRELSSGVIKRAAEMLRSRDVLFKASALFAIGELAAYHRQKNPVYLETHIEFGRLVNEATTMVDHPDDMVRRQAAIAIRKAGEAA